MKQFPYLGWAKEYQFLYIMKMSHYSTLKMSHLGSVQFDPLKVQDMRRPVLFLSSMMLYVIPRLCPSSSLYDSSRDIIIFINLASASKSAFISRTLGSLLAPPPPPDFPPSPPPPPPPPACRLRLFPPGFPFRVVSSALVKVL